MRNENVLFNLISGAHFYACFFYGLKFYEEFVQPYCKIDVKQFGTVAAAAPVYMLNVLAFGALIYVATRPFMLLVEHMVSRLFRVLEKNKGE